MILNDLINSYETLHKYNKKALLIVIIVDNNLKVINVFEYNCCSEVFTQEIRDLEVRSLHEPEMQEIGIIYKCVVQISK